MISKRMIYTDDEFGMSTHPAPHVEIDRPVRKQRLSTRIVASSLLALLVVFSMVCWTLWLSWQLEGAGAAINDTGSLRMRANRVGLDLLQGSAAHRALAEQALAEQRATLARLQAGNPARPLFLPDVAAIAAQMRLVDAAWRQRLQPAAERAIAGGAPTEYLQALPAFVDQADRLVRMIEIDNAGKTTLLRLSQAVLLVIACVGTLAMIYLLFLWIISPVMRLQGGLQRMTAREFGVRLPVESQDELGMLARGFNRMADELEGLYRDLEARVQKKTAQLAEQNRDLSALYDMAAFLNQPNEMDVLCRGFLQRVMQQFQADGGSIRVIDPYSDNLHLVVSEGLSAAIEDAEHCMKVDACFCGEAVTHGVVVIRDFRKLPAPEQFHCAKEGFKGLAVFKVVSQNEVLGSFSLHFRRAHEIPAHEARLLETLGQHLGVALANRRLSAKARQLAVAEERNLMAQGLHDSIAQGLNFLNLQVQILGRAVTQQNLAEIHDIVPRLRMGIDESYQDVRELLANFRDKLGPGELHAGIRETVARFKRQTGIEVRLEVGDIEGAPLPPEHQLQVLFILQEALSNVRKHAQATRVAIHIQNQRDFEMAISDNGVGYDPAGIAARGEQHVGLHIMHERAARMHAILKLDSHPGAGTKLQLTLPQAERQVA